MYRYVVSFWDEEENMVGIDVAIWEEMVDPMFPERLPMQIPSLAASAIISCELTEDNSLVYLAGYLVELKNGEN